MTVPSSPVRAAMLVPAREPLLEKGVLATEPLAGSPRSLSAAEWESEINPERLETESSGPVRQETIRTQIKKVVKNDLGTLPVIASPFQHRPYRETNWDNSQAVKERLRERVLLSCVIMFAEGFYATQFFPYGAWMVQELRGTSHNVGLYTGLLSTAQSSGMLITAYLWASISNRRGRRLCLLVGLLAGLCTTTLQAFSTNYWVVAAARFCAGLLNSNLSIMRTALRETFQHEKSEDTWAFSTLSVAFSASCMAGPSLGGLMYGKSVPMLEGMQNPWSASMLTCVFLYAICLAFTWWRLPETAFLASQRGSTRRTESTIDEQKGQPLLHDANFLLLLVMGGGHSYVFTGWEIVYPLTARLPLEERGEQWTAAQIGVTFLMGSFFLCLYSLVCYPRIAQRLPIVRLWSLSWVAPLLVMPAFPRLLAAMCSVRECAENDSSGLVTALNYGAQVCVSVLLGSGFISIQVILNNYVGARPDGKSALALANSMLVSMQALVRAASPLVTGSLFVFGLGQEDSPGRWAFSRSLPFDSLALIGLAACLLCALAFESRVARQTAGC
jgi:MFS family permease